MQVRKLPLLLKQTKLHVKAACESHDNIKNGEKLLKFTMSKVLMNTATRFFQERSREMKK